MKMDLTHCATQIINMLNTYTHTYAHARTRVLAENIFISTTRPSSPKPKESAPKPSGISHLQSGISHWAAAHHSHLILTRSRSQPSM